MCTGLGSGTECDVVNFSKLIFKPKHEDLNSSKCTLTFFSGISTEKRDKRPKKKQSVMAMYGRIRIHYTDSLATSTINYTYFPPHNRYGSQDYYSPGTRLDPLSLLSAIIRKRDGRNLA